MKTLLALGILLVSALLALVVQSARLRQTRDEVRALQSELSRVRAELAAASAATEELTRLRSREETLRLELARLRGRVTQPFRSEATSSPASPAGEEVPGTGNAEPRGTRQPGGGSLLGGRAMERLVDSRLNLARERLNLTPEQEQGVREAVNLALRTGQENLRRLFAGETTYDEVPTWQEWAHELEQQILTLLNPEQQAAYLQQRQQEQIANARMTANTELLLVQGSLGLDVSQQDAMFAVLYEHALRQQDPDPQRPRNPVAALEWEAEQKRRALEGVLTPAQLENYRRLQDSYRNAVSRFLPATPSPSGARN